MRDTGAVDSDFVLPNGKQQPAEARALAANDTFTLARQMRFRTQVARWGRRSFYVAYTGDPQATKHDGLRHTLH
jgi:hypothetical protein